MQAPERAPRNPEYTDHLFKLLSRFRRAPGSSGIRRGRLRQQAVSTPRVVGQAENPPRIGPPPEGSGISGGREDRAVAGSQRPVERRIEIPETVRSGTARKRTTLPLHGG